jgi:hypothetical protein
MGNRIYAVTAIGYSSHVRSKRSTHCPPFQADQSVSELDKRVVAVIV